MICMYDFPFSYLKCVQKSLVFKNNPLIQDLRLQVVSLLPRDIMLFVHMIFYFYSSTDCFLRCLTFPCLLRQFHVKLIFKRLVIGEALVSMGFKMKKALGLMAFLRPLLTCIFYRTNRHEYVTQKASCIYAYLEFRFPLAVIKKFIYPPEKKK